MKFNIFLVLGIIACVALVAFNAIVTEQSATAEDAATVVKQDSSSGEASIGGSFSLSNTKGEAVKDSDFKGKLMLVYFGFTSCPEICPTDVNIMSQTMELLGEDAIKIAPIFITLDPERDTGAKMADFVANFHPSIIPLTGTRDAIDAAIKAYRIYAKKVEMGMEGEYMYDHSAYFYLMDKEGKYIRHFASKTKPEIIAASVRENF